MSYGRRALKIGRHEEAPGMLARRYLKKRLRRRRRLEERKNPEAAPTKDRYLGC